jgi:hypothetical protein
MFQVVNNTTGEVLFESSDAVAVGVRVNDVERGVMSANKDDVSIYLRDPIQGRANVDLGRSGFGLWAKMRL